MSLKVNSSSTLTRQKLAAGSIKNGGRKTAIVQKAMQVPRQYHRNVIRSQTLSPSSTLFQGTSRFVAVLEASSFSRLKKLTLQYTLANADASNAYTVVPCQYHFEKIRILSGHGSTELATIYADQLALAAGSKTDAEQVLYGMTGSAGMFSAAGVVRQPAYSGDTIAASGSVTLQLPIDISCLHNSELWYQNVGQDVHIELHPRNGITTASSGTNITVSSMSFNIESEILEESDSISQSKFFDKAIYNHQYLDVVKVTDVSATLTANTVYRLNLDAVEGLSPFIHVVVTGSSVSNTSNGYFTWTDLLEGTIDVETASRKSVFGQGQAVNTNLVRYNQFADHMPGSTFSHTKACYIIPFCENVKEALEHGIMRGGHHFDGSKYSLVFTPGTGFSSTTYTITAYVYVYANLTSHKGKLSTSRVVPPKIKLSE